MTDTAARVEGLITPAVGRALHALAGRVPAGRAIVEVGSYRGMSTIYLASAAPDGVPVYAVDPWELVDVAVWCGHCEQPTRAQFEAQLSAAGLLDRVTIRQGLSVDVAAGYDGPPVGLLFVDGDHHYGAVWADLVSWQPQLAARSVVAIDDYAATSNPDVARAVDTWVAANGRTLTVEAGGRLAVCR